MNFTNIINLANRSNKSQDEFVTENLSTEIQEALTEALADEKKSTAKEAAMEIVNIFKDTKAKEAALVEEIRALRRKEAELKACLAKIKTARDYANTTSNYIPLALAIGHHIPAVLRRSYPDLMEIKNLSV